MNIPVTSFPDGKEGSILFPDILLLPFNKFVKGTALTI